MAKDPNTGIISDMIQYFEQSVPIGRSSLVGDGSNILNSDRSFSKFADGATPHGHIGLGITDMTSPSVAQWNENIASVTLYPSRGEAVKIILEKDKNSGVLKSNILLNNDTFSPDQIDTKASAELFTAINDALKKSDGEKISESILGQLEALSEKALSTAKPRSK